MTKLGKDIDKIEVGMGRDGEVFIIIGLILFLIAAMCEIQIQKEGRIKCETATKENQND